MDRLAKKGMLRRLLAGWSLEEVQHSFRLGVVPYEVFTLYCSIWRNCQYRYSSEMIGYERGWRKLAQAVIAEN